MSEPLIVTRFAPSPTGLLHLGNVRTALVNFVFARQHNGRFLLRMEDTDKERSSNEHLKGIIDDLTWLGLQWDGEIVRQSERVARYREQAMVLLDRGLAYPCFCTEKDLKARNRERVSKGLPPKYDGPCGRLGHEESRARMAAGEPCTIRFRLDGGSVCFNDLLRGERQVSLKERGDFVILRQDGTPTYHLAVVVDDGDFGVTHVIRGEDHLPNTPIQVSLCRALGYRVPTYCHLPLIRESKDRVMEKREGDSPFAVRHLREQGFLPQAILDALAMLGCGCNLSPPVGLRGLIDHFDLRELGLSSPVLTMEHLLSVNRAWIMGMELGSLAAVLNIGSLNISAERLEEIVAVVRENSSTLRELEAWVMAVELGSSELGLESGEREILSLVLDLWKRGGPSTDSLRKLVKSKGLKVRDVMPVVRMALVGRRHGPPMDRILELLTPSQVLSRLEKAAVPP